MFTELALKDRYLNEDIKFLINSVIIEYDMKDAGISLIRKYKLLPKEVIDHLKKTNDMVVPGNNKAGKKKANVEIGKMQRDNEVLKQDLFQLEIHL